jgi:thioredoxin reductase (NADPH)
MTTNCDVIILGSGPAGLSSAIYAARSKLSTVVIDTSMTGGQVATTYSIENYPGISGGINGIDLMENMKKQAISFGTRIDEFKQVLEIDFTKDEKYIKTQDSEYYAKALIVATGAQPKKLEVEKESEYRGKGIHYCATCDGALYSDTDVFVVGGGESALQEALFLTRFAKKVIIIHRRDKFKASKSLQDEVFKNLKITCIWNSIIKSVYGDNFLKGIVSQNLKTGELKEIPGEAIFVYIGNQPKSEPFKNILNLNEQGYIITDQDMQTNIPGVFAAGDIREKKIRQITTAVADGTIAGIMVEKFINR